MFFLMFFLIFFLIVFIKLKLKIYHPLMITFFIWLFVFILYTYVPSGLFPLSPNVYCVVLTYLFFFLLGSFFCYLMLGRCPIKNEVVCIPEKYKTTGIFNFVLFLSIYLLYRYILIFLSGSTLYKEIVQGRLSTDLKVLFYFDKLALVYFFYIISLKKLKRNEKIYVCIFFVMTFLKFSKMDIMQLFVGCVLILWIKRKLNVRHIVILSCLIFALITFIHLFRAKDSNKGSVIDGISQMLAIYFLSPIKAFDLIVNQNIHFEKYQTFILLDRILVKIFSIKTNISCDTFDGWVYVPFPTNVYTCLWRFYSDFGILGVIFFGYLLGFSWTLLFEKRNKPVFQLIYFTLSYILVFQFFSDIIFGFTSQIIQVVILTILLFHLKNNRGLRQDCINVFSIKKRKCNEC